jgi:glycoside/pentoside/hexuronide:cation symporter, GPH family
MADEQVVEGQLSDNGKEVFPLWRMIFWAFGAVGNTIASSLIGLITYFYLPPETEQAAFPELISSQTFMGLTVIGIAGFIGTLLPVLLEPAIGSLSDRSQAKMGRRRFFMLISFLPFAFFSYAIFMPPSSQAGWLNAGWVILMMVLFNISRSAYQISFGALAPELGRTNKMIMLFSTLSSLAWVIGFIFGSQLVFVIKDAFASSGMTVLEAFRVTVAGLAVLAALFMAGPIIVVDEKRYCSGKTSRLNMMAALKKAFTNKTFMIFSVADFTYAMGDMLFQMGLIYFVTILLGLGESMVLTIGVALIALSILQYPIVNLAARKIGKKSIFLVGLILMIITLLLIASVDKMPLSPNIMVWVIIVVASIPAAITGIIPGSILTEIIREDALRTSDSSEAIYGAASGLIRKIPGSIPPLILPSLLILGKSVENPFGVRMVALVAAGFMSIAVLLLLFYNEKGVIRSLKAHGYESELEVD